MAFLKTFISTAMPIMPLISMLYAPRADFVNSPKAQGVHHKLQKIRDSWDSEYDYIIVGGGSAGAVLANRLSEDEHLRVLLLEAGGTENMISDVPIAFQNLQQTPMDWNYVTEPQRAACFGFKNKVSRL